LATPFLSLFVSRTILAWTGCDAAVFDPVSSPCFSSGGIVQNRLAPLTVWVLAIFSPYIFIKQFWDVIAVWIGAILILKKLSRNPSSIVQSEVAKVPQKLPPEGKRLNLIASAQQFMIFVLIGLFIATAAHLVVGPQARMAVVLASLVAVFGAVRLASALGLSLLTKSLYAVSMLIPLINLLAMLALSSRAIKILRAGGYRVGLFGVRSR
jgi:hypothetical protein